MKKLQIVIRNHRATITTRDIPGVLAVLHNKCVVGEIGWRMHHQARPEQDVIFLLASLVPEAFRTLAANGYEVTVKDNSWWFQYAFVAQQGGAKPLAWSIEKAVLDNPRGQLVVDRLEDRLSLLSQLLSLFPPYRFLIATKNNAIAQQVADGLRGGTKRQVLTYYRRVRPDGILVCPANSLGCATAQEFPVIIYWDVEAARAKRTAQKPWHQDCALAYAFVRSDRRLDPDDQFRIAMVFGDVIYEHYDHAPDPGFTTVQVMLAGPSVYPPSADQQAVGHDQRRRRRRASCSALERKRSNIWQNERRNQHIASIAQACRDRDVQALQRAGIVIDDPAAVFAGWCSEPRVAVVVEVVEHARELGKLLPGWPQREAGQLPAMVAADRDQVVENLQLTHEAAILSQGYAQQVGIAADIVIVADGMSRYWPEYLGPDCCINGDRMLVIDYQDDFDQQAKQDAEARRQDYQGRIWEICGL